MQRAMNMYRSQHSHGIIKGDDFDAAGVTTVKLGYAPAMIKIMAVLADDVPREAFHWYAVEPDYVFKFNATGQWRRDSFLNLIEQGFQVGGGDLIAASSGTPVGFIFEAVGSEPKDASDDPHPDPVAADEPMPAIEPYLPPPRTNSSETLLIDSDYGTVTGDPVTGVVDVPSGTTVDQLVGGLTISDGATAEVLTESGGTTVDGETEVTATMVILVTAEDGVTTSEYTIAMLG